MTAKKLKLVGAKSKKVKKQVPMPENTVLIKSSIKWDDAFPYLEEVYRTPEGASVEVAHFYSTERDNKEFEAFLYKVIRCNSLPSFIKANFKKIKKIIEKELSHRDKMYEKLSKEQVKALESYFADDMFFDRDDSDEYFKHEMEKVSISYLKAYLETSLYESKARQSNRRRNIELKKLGLD